MARDQGAGAALLAAFPSVILINLRDRPDRRREAEGELRRLGLGLDHPAVTLLAVTRPAEAGGFPSRGARGCFESHLAAMRMVAAGPAPRALILEDDADLTPRLGPALASLPGGWGMLFGIWSGADPAPPRPAPGWVEARPAVALLTTHFTAVTREAAALLVPHLEAILARPPGHPEGGPMHVDGAYNWFRAARPDLLTLCADPAISVQRPSRTDVQEPRWADRQPLLRPLLGLARRALRPLRVR